MRFVLVLAEATPDGAPLSEAGLRQMQAVARELRDQVAEPTILSSPALAALDAARHLATALGAPPPDARVELAPPSESASAHPEALEGLAPAQEQAWSLIEDAKTRLAPDAALLFVTHELTVRLLVCRALSMPLSEMHRFALEPGSISTIEWRTQPRERLLIGSLNEICHLEATNNRQRSKGDAG